MNQYDSTQTLAALAPVAQPRIFPVARPCSPDISLEPADSAGRSKLEACIADRFNRQYGARIEEFLPFLLSLNVADRLGAVIGLRLAATSPLFLEQYIDTPVEQAVSKVFGTPVDRAQIVEIGNLASAAPGSAALMFGLLPAILREAGIRWVVCTATPQVRVMLKKVDFATRTICVADPKFLGDKQADWGTYYASCPHVIVGDVQRAAERADMNPDIAALLRNLDGSIRPLAAKLGMAR
jgi:hypothetical protein